MGSKGTRGGGSKAKAPAARAPEAKPVQKSKTAWWALTLALLPHIPGGVGATVAAWVAENPEEAMAIAGAVTMALRAIKSNLALKLKS